MNKVPLLLGIVCFVIYRLLLYQTGNIWFSMLIFLFPIGLLIVNFSLRKKLSFANWFLSPWNILLEKSKYSIESDIESTLLIEKLLEELQETEFKILDSDVNRLQILVGTSANFWTWGENIYIQIDALEGESKIQFTSVTLFGNTSWNRNDKNFQSFIQMFESSLTI